MLIQDIKNDHNFKRFLLKGLMFLALFYVVDFSVNLFLSQGLKKFYGLGEDTEIALIGHSHLMLGVDKQQLETGMNTGVSKYTRQGVNVADRDIMIDQLLQSNPKLKTVIYGVDAWMFTGEGLSENSYKLFYPFMGQKEARLHVKKHASFFDYYIHLLVKSSRYTEELFSSAFRGYMSNWSNLKLGTVDTVKLKKNIADGDIRKINSTAENRIIFEKSIKKLNDRGINVVLLYVPTINLYNRYEPAKFNAELEYFRSIDKQYDGVSYIEYLEPYSSDYTIFFDPIHLNPKGQKLITEKLIVDLKNLKDSLAVKK